LRSGDRTETCPVVAYEAWIAAAGIHTARRSTSTSGQHRLRNCAFTRRSHSWSVFTEASSMSPPSAKVYTRINLFRLSLLALVVSILSYAIEDFLIFRADIWGTWFSDRRVTFLVYVIVLTPLVEETVRVQVVRLAEKRRWLEQPVSLQTAIFLGALIGTFEWVAKSIWLEPALTGKTILGLIAHFSSFPIHIALSCAFFSFRSERFVKTAALHVLTNFTIIIVAVTLTAQGWDGASLAYVLAMLATVILVSVLVVWRPVRVLRRLMKPGLPVAG
jgi:hypothetical protein